MDKYLDLLQKCFIIFRLQSFSSNLRNEIKKSSKYYFYDNGILKCPDRKFNPLQNRNDVGVLWKNLVISEFVKHYNNMDVAVIFYFWCTYDGAEIDLIIEENLELTAFEVKWSAKKKANLPESFRAKYGVEMLATINPQSLHLVFEAK